MKRFFQAHALFLLISAFFFVQGIIAIAEDTPFVVYGTVTLWFAGVLAVEILILVWAPRPFPLRARGVIHNALASFFVALNIIAFYVSFLEEFLSQELAVQAFVLVALWSITAHVLHASSGRALLRSTISVILVINMVVALAYPAVTKSGAAKGVGAGTNPYDAVVLKEKPNVHLIAVDSMLPDTLAGKHLGFHPAYHRILEAHGATIFKNLFVSYAPTTHSLRSVALLSDPRNLPEGAVAGRGLGPLYRIFRNSGYRVSFGYASGKKAFGVKGPYVDEYFSVNPWGKAFSESALCKYQGDSERRYQLLGFCAIASWLEPGGTGTWDDFVVQQVGSKGQSETPWLTFYYVYSLGHTSKEYRSDHLEDFREYREAFLEKQASLSQDWLVDVIETIQANDPDSIVFIFGDHGPWLSRTVSFEEMPGFFVQDRYGVFGAVLPTNSRCARDEPLSHYFDGFGTPERVIAGIIRCLAERPEAMDRAVNFTQTYDYKQFLYDDIN